MSTDKEIELLSFASAEREPLCPFQYPSFDAISQPSLLGLQPPSEEQKQRVEQIILDTPNGPRPLDIAQSFIDRFYTAEPLVISQWPTPKPWNPLIVDFFKATSDPANNDTIPWCAAFLNWCLRRAGRPTTSSSSSQSFASTDLYSITQLPIEGDIAVFTCYDKKSGKTMGLGHVTFFRERISDDRFLSVGGNQSGTCQSMICQEEFSYTFDSRRHIGSNYVAVTYKLNRFLRVA